MKLTLQSIGKGPMIGFAMSAAVLLATALLWYLNLQRVAEQQFWVAHTHEVLDSLSDTLGSLTEAESDMRGYVITGDDIFLRPYRVARDAIPGRLARIRGLVKDNPAQVERLDELQTLIEERIKRLESGINARAKAFEPARAQVATGGGVNLMVGIRTHIDQMEQAEITLLADRKQQAATSYWTAMISGFLAVFVCLFMVSAAFVLVRGEFMRRQRIESSLRDSEARTRAMFESALDAIVSMDHNGRIIDFNEAAEATFSCGRADAVGQILAEFMIPPPMRALHEQGLERYLRTGVGPILGKRIEMTALRATGEEFPIELSVTRIPVDGPPTFSAYLRDISDRKRAELEIRRAQDELEQRVQERTEELNVSNDALMRSNRELEQFASVASHDLQEPLRKIQAFGDRLQSVCATELGERGADYLQRILRSASRMRTLIDDLLSFSRVTTRAQPFVDVDLATIAQEVATDLEGRLEQSQGRLEIGPLPTLEADPTQMRQLLQNLLSNALKFRRPEAAPVVQVTARPIEIEGGDGWELSICDNGIGFEEIYLDRIFNLFQRLHGRNEYEGTGIGLAICRKIVERHHGRITARSQLGQGSTFLVQLPRVQPRLEGTE
ncbi:MAG TPA: CHASE3 domain-containing protein [Planctomycetaceae bacterium]|nr:CHASE3 domain-containing protein [Planctomycetaceae bacterium]